MVIRSRNVPKRKSVLNRQRISYNTVKGKELTRSNINCNTGYEGYSEQLGWHCTHKPKKDNKYWRPYFNINDKKPKMPKQFKLKDTIMRKMNNARSI